MLLEKADDGMRPNWEAFVDRNPNPEESYVQRERTEFLTEAANRLGSKVRTTMLLREMEERSVEETAGILGTSIAAVKARVFQGRRKLRGTVNAGLFPGVYEYGRAEAQRR